jgi:hypothetical protein
MKLKRTRESYYVFASPEDAGVALELAFYFSKDKTARIVSAKKAQESNGLLDIEVCRNRSGKSFTHFMLI